MSLQNLLKTDHDTGIKIMWKNREWSSPIKLRSVLADSKCYPGDAVVNVENGFYIVPPDESVIFVSSAADSKSNMGRL